MIDTWKQTVDDYRVRQDGAVYHAEMLYGIKEEPLWVPLNADGYWADPDCFSTGRITIRAPMEKAEADRAVWLAMKINRPQEQSQ